MYKVLIAEDELLIRIGIKTSCEWQAYNMTVVADVSTGREAWHAFLEHRPQLVLADIRMPEMNGLELIRHIRNIDSACHIIIISCVEDFSTIQQAMRYDVSDYLLKLNITPNEIHTALAKAQQRLNQVYGDEEPSRAVIQSSGASLAENIGSFLKGESMHHSASTLKQHLGFFPKHCLMLHVATEPKDNGMKVETLYEMVRMCLPHIAYSPFVQMPDHWHVCLFSNMPGDNKQFYDGLIHACAHYEKLFSHKVSAICPNPVRIEELPKIYQKILAAYGDGYWCKGMAVIIGDVFAALVTHQAAAVRYLLNHELLEHILPEEARYEYNVGVEKIRTDSIQIFENGLIDMVSRIMTKVHGHTPSDISELARKIFSHTTAFDAVDTCMQYIEQSVYAFQPFTTKRREIRRALQYISRYYASNITLSDIAMHVGLSANYFSNLFKKETGMTFIAYLNHYRVQKAEALLKNSDLYAYQVAEQCGFSDETYFSRIFKQVTGMRPSAYCQKERGGYGQ